MNEVLRQEHKFLINQRSMYCLAKDLALIMEEDPHNRGVGYPIRSLYFDSLEDRDYEDKEDGIELRRKIRLRCYSPGDSFAMLEMKQKQGGLQKKRSLRMSRGDAVRLIGGNYGVLLGYSEPFAAECFGLMNMYVYRPKAVVEYKRRAFIAKENNIRITFDHSIICSESRFNIFAPDLVENSALDPYLAVLEVKYNGFLPSYIKDILQSVNESESSVGKYSLSRAISKHYTF